MSYSKLNTIKKREQLKRQFDNFSTFQWRGKNMFDFGVFIINDKKGSLKFYNGPGFSNEYSKPQFSTNSGDLIGVNFNRQSISFTVGVYWINAQDYRKLIAWLDPLVTGTIIFDFEPRYRYNVKLSKIGDSTRWVIGEENGEKMYYTELSLTFELQGDQCAKGVNSYEFPTSYTPIIEDKKVKWEMSIKTTNDKGNPIEEFMQSDLDTPFETSIALELISNLTSEENKPIDSIKYSVKYGDDVINLFSIVLKNLKYSSQEEVETINLKYNSETGILLLKRGDSDEEIISLLTTTDRGNRIVQNYSSTKFLIPGQFNYPEFHIENLKFILEYERQDKDGEIIDETSLISKALTSVVFECFPRTNVI